MILLSPIISFVNSDICESCRCSVLVDVSVSIISSVNRISGGMFSLRNLCLARLVPLS